ncbi:MAG: Rieske (2Fe-2S) protein [Dehalococcoidia bacterium]
MPATVLVAPGERPAIGFALARVSAFYASGTKEQRDSAETLYEMLQGLEQTPPGVVEMDFLTQDAFLLGVRLFTTSVELEEYWLDARERADGRGAELEPPDQTLDSAVRHYFPELVDDPSGWDFDQARGSFNRLGFKVDRAVSTAAPRARALYNMDRDEMTDSAIAARERRPARRTEATSGVPVTGHASVATEERPSYPAPQGWGVDVQTGLSPDEIPAESFRALTVGSVTVLITNYGGNLGAISGRCSHQDANISKGHVQGARIQCPRHGAEFDLTTGRQLCPPFCPRWMAENGMKAKVLQAVTPEKTGGDLLTYPLRVENGEIIVRI